MLVHPALCLHGGAARTADTSPRATAETKEVRILNVLKKKKKKMRDIATLGEEVAQLTLKE